MCKELSEDKPSEHRGWGHGTKLGTCTVPGTQECRARQGRATKHMQKWGEIQTAPSYTHCTTPAATEGYRRTRRDLPGSSYSLLDRCVLVGQESGGCLCQQPPSWPWQGSVSQPCCRHRATVLGKGWAFTGGWFLSATSPDQHIPPLLRWATAAQEEAEQGSKRRQKRGNQLVRARAGRLLRVLLAGATTCLCFSPLPSRKPFAKRQPSTVGERGERVNVCGSRGKPGPAIVALGQSPCRSFPRQAAGRAGQGGLGREGWMGSCLAERPALLSAHGRGQGHG